MPFAKFRTELAAKGGTAALQERLPFDELALLTENKDFLLRWVPLARRCLLAAGAG